MGFRRCIGEDPLVGACSRKAKFVFTRNGESKGFGFVTMETDEDADEAVYKLDQTTWNGRVVLVEKAKSDKRVD
jgi:RNA recognition motif-containing protein